MAKIPSKGSSAYLSIEDEAVYGTDPASAPENVKIVSGSMTPAGEIFPADRGLGGMAPSDPQNKAKRTDADYVFDLRYGGYELLLWHFLGSVVDDGVIDVSAHGWTFYPDDDRDGAGTNVGPGGLSVIQNNPVTVEAPETEADAYLATGMIPTDMSLLITNAALEMTMPLVGLPHETHAELTTPSFPQEPIILGMGDCAGGFGMVAEYATHPIDRDLATTYTALPGFTSATIASAIPYDTAREFVGCEDIEKPLLDGPMTVTVEITREHAGDLFASFWRDNTQLELRFTFESQIVIPTTTTKYTFQVIVPQCLVTSAMPTISDNGVNEETISLEGFWDQSFEASGGPFQIDHNIRIVLINTRANLP